MRNKRLWVWSILIVIFILLGALVYNKLVTTFTNNPRNETINDGIFTKSISNPMTVTYNLNSNDGLHASLDFALKAGKVDWEIVNPENIIVYKGYVIFENAKVFKQITDFSYSLCGNYAYSKNKEEVKNEMDANGKIIIIPDFNYLQFDINSISGEYKLILKPTNAEGSYMMIWRNYLPRK